MDKLDSKPMSLPHRANYQQQIKRTKQDFKENSGDIAAGSAVGTATFASLRNSTKIGNSAVNLIKSSKVIQETNKTKILKILGKGKFMTNPIVQKVAGFFAGFAALSTVAASTAKVVDTCQYLEHQKQTTNA